MTFETNPMPSSGERIDTAAITTGAHTARTQERVAVINHKRYDFKSTKASNRQKGSKVTVSSSYAERCQGTFGQ